MKNNLTCSDSESILSEQKLTNIFKELDKTELQSTIPPEKQYSDTDTLTIDRLNQAFKEAELAHRKPKKIVKVKKETFKDKLKYRLK